MNLKDATVGELARSVTRPALTAGALAAWIGFIALGTEYPGAFQWLTVAMCLEWFTERAYTRLKELRGQPKGGRG